MQLSFRQTARGGGDALRRLCKQNQDVFDRE